MSNMDCFCCFLFLSSFFYLRASLVAQMVKRLPAVWETWVWSLGWEDHLEKEMATHSSTLAWKIPWMEEPGRLQSTGLQRVGHDWVTSLSFLFLLPLTIHLPQTLSIHHKSENSVLSQNSPRSFIAYSRENYDPWMKFGPSPVFIQIKLMHRLNSSIHEKKKTMNNEEALDICS